MSESRPDSTDAAPGVKSGPATAEEALRTLPDNSSVSVTLEGRTLILVKHRGELYLYANSCPHTGESLDPMGGELGRGGGELLRCQRHGAEFLAASGECVAGPCQGEHLTPVPFTLAGDQIYLD